MAGGWHRGQPVGGAALSAKLGIAISHTILRWVGEKPTTGIPAAARQARYALLADWARTHDADRILLGHTRDDQAETVAYRIASNGGARGASGLRPLSVCPIWPEGRGVLLARPLLQTRRADLQSFLRDRDKDWIDDPSNEDQTYGRPRIRAKLAALGASKPDLIPRLAAIGDKLAAEQAAIEAEALQLLEQHLEFDPFGAGLLDTAPLRTAPRDVRAAALSFAILAVSGEAHAPPLAAMPGLWTRLEAKACAVTLGGARVGRLGARFGHRLLLTRDPGAAAGRGQPKPDLVLLPGATGVFDGRFEMSTGPDLTGPVHIRALGAAAALNPADAWERLLAAGLVRDFEVVRLGLIGRLATGADPVAAVEAWLAAKAAPVGRLAGECARAREGGEPTAAMLAHLASLARAVMA